MKKFFSAVFVLLIVLLGVLLSNTLTLKSKQIKSTQMPSGTGLKTDSLAVQHLAQAIRIKTISYDDTMKMQNSAATFDTFLTFLKTSYPLVFSSLEDTVIGGKNLLLKWKGTNSNLPPVILYAHMDVVPIEENTISQWKHAPFSGDIADDFVWGRGAIDDKGSLISIFEALNRLLQKGFKPQSDFYLASGSDEEIGGHHGAALIADYCRRNKLHFGFYLDEGLMVAQGIVPNIKKDVALIGTAEKGYVTFELSVNMKGGHSSSPADETALDVLVKAVKKVHDKKFDKRATEPISEFVDYMGPEMPMPLRIIFANKWLFKGLILDEYAKTSKGNAMVRTTGVATIMNAGIKENVIPSLVSAKINFRILPGETAKGVEARVKDIIHDDRVQIVAEEATEPSKTTSASSPGFQLLQKTCSEIFPDALVAPFLMIGSTDSKHFADLTDETYRFFPTRLDQEALDGFHGVNEKIRIPYYMETISFYERLLINMQTFSAENKK